MIERERLPRRHRGRRWHRHRARSPARSRAGANVLVAGSALFRDPDGLAHAVSDLRARGVAAQQSASA